MDLILGSIGGYMGSFFKTSATADYGPPNGLWSICHIGLPAGYGTLKKSEAPI